MEFRSLAGCGFRTRLQHVFASQLAEGLPRRGVEELEPEACPGQRAPQADGERQRRRARQNIPGAPKERREKRINTETLGAEVDWVGLGINLGF